MKGFWKWFFIVLGVLLLIAIAFGVTLFFLRGGFAVMQGTRIVHPGLMMRGFGFGMGLWMIFRLLFGLGFLVLAGFGVAYLVKSPEKQTAIAAASSPVSANTSAAPSVEKVATTVPVCSNCGKALSPEWVACPYCGHKNESVSTPPSPVA